MNIVAYIRVSTAMQGRSGLGLEAQRAAIATYAKHQGATITREVVEIESGTEDERPGLNEALHYARVTGATIAVAKLDRLTRDTGFFSILKKSGARFIALDLPTVDSSMDGLFAWFAERERELISQRTKAALAAYKVRAASDPTLRPLGNPNGAAAFKRAGKGNADSVKALKANADRHAEDLRPIIARLAQRGVTSLGEIAAHLTAEGVLTPRGNGHWHKASVRNLLARLAPHA